MKLQVTFDPKNPKPEDKVNLKFLDLTQKLKNLEQEEEAKNLVESFIRAGDDMKEKWDVIGKYTEIAKKF